MKENFKSIACAKLNFTMPEYKSMVEELDNVLRTRDPAKAAIVLDVVRIVSKYQNKVKYNYKEEKKKDEEENPDWLFNNL